ncbi:ferric citrate ABC transporter ATP-binding protein FecE [Vibrio sp. 10N.286.49.C2]|uniref:Fe(3+) dicitrate ABC transporter ATP-binding protein FecE n=1 Tax=unclassified Vibrio TaxID=2614977 RepID=UPI000C81F321|nr:MULTISPECIES: Fe(3+) dicitrate ABC transporter ATP-binding protein FecE [unclassified Vibrio]PMH43353.1 ferric citrate ABC transporter ATP-binding protein FecE [Vibrio sp. 10N.286.49.C2]PMH57005.1 ferric citrate ABC transporter ATP-binding protein FecE [Vibrio sp. 10N.286.49.B1]PMH79867.1 ferric citrate ABC transporter ATP-binding protein FecE [Vibrio sp. 10N.286.48.B7]
MLSVQHLQVAYGDNVIIDDLSLSIPKGKITALIGPNGCGKSTLLKTLARINKAQSGKVLLDDIALDGIPTKQLAQRLSLLPQIHSTPEGITVRKLVEYGRAPYTSHWGKLTKEDRDIVEQSMTSTGVRELADQSVDRLSGGQQQRAWIAMIIAQDTDIVMLDEPTTYLDLSHQIELMNLMHDMHQKGKTVIVVLHDLNQACRYCEHLVVLEKGKLIAQGSPNQVFTESMLHQVFNLDAIVIQDPVSQSPMCIAR